MQAGEWLWLMSTDQLKGIANDVTPLSNQEDGLAVYLEKLLKLQ